MAAAGILIRTYQLNLSISIYGDLTGPNENVNISYEQKQTCTIKLFGLNLNFKNVYIYFCKNSYYYIFTIKTLT